MTTLTNTVFSSKDVQFCGFGICFPYSHNKTYFMKDSKKKKKTYFMKERHAKDVHHNKIL